MALQSNQIRLTFLTFFIKVFGTWNDMCIKILRGKVTKNRCALETGATSHCKKNLQRAVKFLWLACKFTIII